MIIDTSAVLAILFAESDTERYERAIAAASPCRMSVANLLEASIVVESRGDAAGRDQLDFFVEAKADDLGAPGSSKTFRRWFVWVQQNSSVDRMSAA